MEALLAAKYDLEFCEDGEKHEYMRRFEVCASSILNKHPHISRSQLIEAIGAKYREYKAARIRAQRRRETL